MRSRLVLWGVLALSACGEEATQWYPLCGPSLKAFDDSISLCAQKAGDACGKAGAVCRDRESGWTFVCQSAEPRVLCTD
ncbi:MAG TPA: hypothetical protein VN914_00805 [Polyangia bacterium]|jgi:hypothetical protein|nr:hypothetical protein [Polyangia bacterium]